MQDAVLRENGKQKQGTTQVLTGAPEGEERGRTQEQPLKNHDRGSHSGWDFLRMSE